MNRYSVSCRLAGSKPLIVTGTCAADALANALQPFGLLTMKLDSDSPDGCASWHIVTLEDDSPVGGAKPYRIAAAYVRQLGGQP